MMFDLAGWEKPAAAVPPMPRRDSSARRRPQN